MKVKVECWIKSGGRLAFFIYTGCLNEWANEKMDFRFVVADKLATLTFVRRPQLQIIMSERNIYCCPMFLSPYLANTKKLQLQLLLLRRFKNSLKASPVIRNKFDIKRIKLLVLRIKIWVSLSCQNNVEKQILFSGHQIAKYRST